MSQTHLVVLMLNVGGGYYVETDTTALIPEVQTGNGGGGVSLDRYSTFLTVNNNRVGNPIDADHPDHLPDR